MVPRPLLSYSFLLTFEGNSSITKNVMEFDVDEAIKQFTITFMVPIDNREEFQKELNFRYFYLDEVTLDGIPIHSEIYHVNTIVKKHRKYNYGAADAVTMTMIGTYK